MSEHERYFATRFAEDPRRGQMWAHLNRYLAAYVPANAAVLELGAGYCYFINGVAARRRVAVDLSDTVRQAAASGVETVVGDALEALRAMPAAEFDFVFASNFLEHFEWPVLDAMASEIRRVLKPGGRLGLVQPNFRLQPGRYFDDYTHRAIFTDVSLGDWLAASGFRVTTMVPRFLPLTVKSRLGGLSFLMPVYLRLPWRPLAGQMFVVAERPTG
ncbi:MAG: class I SAM-dependent methyltransferase [Acidobacteria bacterium]|nr:class I SAM-dependent methyltransferase [Acidobacteriota bacterium]